MPGINGKALSAAIELADDVLNLELEETLELNFKGESMIIKRIK